MDIFFAIAEPTRRQIVELLAKKGRLSATQISGHFDISAAGISQHLKVLREAKVVTMSKSGKYRDYFLNPKALAELQSWAYHQSYLWNQRFNKLETLLKRQLK